MYYENREGRIVFYYTFYFTQVTDDLNKLFLCNKLEENKQLLEILAASSLIRALMRMR